MNEQRNSRSRRPVLATIAACALALTLMGARTSGVSAAQEQTCSVIPAGQPDGGVSTGGQSGGSDAQGTVTGGEAEGCFTIAGPGTTFSLGGGTTCSMTLPEGAAPGSTVVVNTQSGAMGLGPGTSCSISIIPPGGFGFGVGGVVAGGQVCSIAVPADGAPGVAATPEAGTSAGTDGVPTDAQQIVQVQGCGPITMTPIISGTENAVLTPSCVIVIDGNAQSGSGAGTAGASTGGNTSGEAGTASSGNCTDGQAGAGATTTMQGGDAGMKEQTCDAGVPNGGASTGGETKGGSASSAAGQTFTCTVTDPNNPNTMVCTAQK